METNNFSQTAAFWNEYISRNDINRAEWFAHPLIQAHHAKIRGDKTIAQWFITKYLAKGAVQHAIGIGAGVASFELSLMEAGVVENYDLYDISEVSLKQAEEHARRAGLEKRVRFFLEDVNQIKLPQEHYDLVTFVGSLHHVTELEAVLQKLYSAIKTGGFLFASEYVGPNHFAYPQEHKQIAMRLYHALAPGLKSPWPELPLPNAEDVIKADPTEAIHSEEIIETVRKVFGNIEVSPLNTALCFIIWWGLNHNALFETQEGFDLVKSLIEIETALVKTGRLPNYFAEMVAYKCAKTETIQPSWQELKNLLLKVKATIPYSRR